MGLKSHLTTEAVKCDADDKHDEIVTQILLYHYVIGSHYSAYTVLYTHIQYIRILMYTHVYILMYIYSIQVYTCILIYTVQLRIFVRYTLALYSLFHY